MLESIITKIVIALVERLGQAARSLVLDSLLRKKLKDRQEERKEIVDKIEIEQVKPKEEQSDDSLRILHRRLRDIDSN